MSSLLQLGLVLVLSGNRLAARQAALLWLGACCQVVHRWQRLH